MEVKFLRRVKFWFQFIIHIFFQATKLYFIVFSFEIYSANYEEYLLKKKKLVGITFWSLEKLGSGLSLSADLHPMLWKVSPLFGIGKQELILGKRCMKQFWAYSSWHLFIGSVSEHLSLVHLPKYHLVITVLVKHIVYKSCGESFLLVQCSWD